jgi:hypothetical protein
MSDPRIETRARFARRWASHCLMTTRTGLWLFFGRKNFPFVTVEGFGQGCVLDFFPGKITSSPDFESRFLVPFLSLRLGVKGVGDSFMPLDPYDGLPGITTLINAHFSSFGSVSKNMETIPNCNETRNKPSFSRYYEGHIFI